MTRFQQLDTKEITQPLRIISVLAEGNTNTVVLVQNEETSQLLAAKIIIDAKRDMLTRMEAEAAIQNNLDHSRILKLEGFQENLVLVDSEGNEMTASAILTEYAPKGDLFDLLCCFNQMPLLLARSYARQMAEAVAYLHESGIAHCDIKLENFLLDSKFGVKLGDFGFSRATNEETTFDEQVGTPQYWAPEQHEHKPCNGLEIDVFSLGMTLFMLVAGTMPFESATKEDEHYMHFINGEEEKFWQKHEEELNPSSARAFFKEDFKTLINGMLCYKASERPMIKDVLNHAWMKMTPDMVEKCGGVVSEYLKKMKIIN